MARTLTEGEQDILSELNDADEPGEQPEDAETIQAEVYADLDAMRDNARRWQEQDDEIRRQELRDNSILAPGLYQRTGGRSGL